MKPKKRYGQNFLINEQISTKICTNSEIKDEIVFEIGPGKGALTKHLLKEARFVYAFEVDYSFKPILNKLSLENTNFKVTYQDILQVDLNKFIDEHNLEIISCVANIPYNITGPILTKLKDIANINKLILMVQKEVGDRLTAKPNSRAYGQLSVVYNYFYNVKKVIDVKRTNFYPIPKVDSVVVRLDRTDKYKSLSNNEDNFLEFVKASFTQKRKTLINNLKAHYHLSNEEVFNKLIKIDKSIDSLIRAEQLTVDEFIILANGWYDD